MKKNCKGCGMPREPRDYFWSSDYHSRTCAINKANKLKEEYWDMVRYLKENK
ncbi:hypothetical protein M0R04_15500 [Candidatus Dojkabacteria bacterium]|jgi:hypothetical protein|nr:hypothetical protein [Candidatus Dojkabacteria bacterium]